LSKQSVNIGSVANDGTGTTLRAGGNIINSNFTELYNNLGDGSNLKINVAGASANNVLIYDSANARFQPGAVAATYSLFVQGTSGAAQLLNSGDTLNILAGTGINTISASTDTVTVSVDNSVVTLTGNQTLTNKVLTSPVINGGTTLTATSTELNLLTGATGIITANNAVTLTNKTINGSNNTITNINASSIGSGNVSNTEFEYLDGVSSNIQNQLYVLSVALGS
jgi:hypothetical protein